MSKRSVFQPVLWICLLWLLLPAACGRKNDPKPPENFAPSAVKFLTARGTVEGVLLEWTAPNTDASGDELLDLESFVVKRSEYAKDESPDFEDIAEILLPSAEDAGENAPRAPEAVQKFSYQDVKVQPGKTYEYSVTGKNEDGVEGEAAEVLRLRYVGESSVIERR